MKGLLGSAATAAAPGGAFFSDACVLVDMSVIGVRLLHLIVKGIKRFADTREDGIEIDLSLGLVHPKIGLPDPELGIPGQGKGADGLISKKVLQAFEAVFGNRYFDRVLSRLLCQEPDLFDDLRTDHRPRNLWKKFVHDLLHQWLHRGMQMRGRFAKGEGHVLQSLRDAPRGGIGSALQCLYGILPTGPIAGIERF
ncbi:hypothetical protein [Sulfitobacter aestuariivivens]|uniref:hypothetical protein n=1 Tax=Sulfitobacter aestuariivivens TaxID=2766981 RepID=UPI0031B5BFB6